MRACEADRCEHGATVNGRWCPRHVPGDTDQWAPEYALEAHSEPVEGDDYWAQEWATTSQYVTVCEERLAMARHIRTELLARMRRDGMSLGDIAEVTGLTRQRIGQLLR